jgi:hypothetical protein
MNSIYDKTSRTGKESFLYIGTITTSIYLFIYSTIKFYIGLYSEELEWWDNIVKLLPSLFFGGIITYVIISSLMFIIERIFFGRIEIESLEDRIENVGRPIFSYGMSSFSLFLISFFPIVDSVDVMINEVLIFVDYIGIHTIQNNNTIIGVEKVIYFLFFILLNFFLIRIFFKKMIFKIVSKEDKESKSKYPFYKGVDFFEDLALIWSIIIPLFFCIGVTLYFYFNSFEPTLPTIKNLIYSGITSLFILFIPTILGFRFGIGKFVIRNFGLSETIVISIISMFLFFNLLKFIFPLIEVISHFIFNFLREDYYHYQNVFVAFLFFMTLIIVNGVFLKFIFSRRESISSEVKI